MKLRSLFIGDLHYHSKNLTDHNLLSKELFNAIHLFSKQLPDKNKPLDLIVLLGDEFEHSNPCTEVRGHFALFVRELRKYCEYMIILVGNHTRKNSRVSSGPEHSLVEMRSCGENGLWVVEDPMIISLTIDGENIDIGALPYMDPPVFNETLEKYCPRLFNYDPSKPIAFVLGHQEINGSKPSSFSVSDCNALWPDHWPPLISGHLHERHYLRNCLWTGTPMQHSLNESREKYIHFGLLHNPTINDHRWKYNEGNFETSCGFLYEYLITNVPVRYKLVIPIEHATQLLVHIRSTPLDYYNVTITYNDCTDLLKSSAYAELRTYPRVTVSTKGPEIVKSEPQKTVQDRTDLQFVDWLKLRSAEWAPEMKELIKTIGGW